MSTYQSYRPEAGIDELWLPCPDFPKYEVSNYGRLRSETGILVLRLTKGYASVGLHRNGKKHSRLVNRLVARAFIGEPCGEKDAAHNNGVRLDNYVSNLRWTTRRENTDDRFDHGTVLFGENHPRATTNIGNINLLRARYAAHMSERESRGYTRARRGFRNELCETFGLSKHVVKDVLFSRSWLES
jgi:hypothetical protein